MPALDPRQKAERISAIFRARQPIDILPAELIPANLEEAYRVSAAYDAIESAAGRGAVAGYKIGLTTPIMQKLCGVDEPCFGAIFANEVHHHCAELSVDAFCRLGVETEIAVRLGADLPQGGDIVREFLPDAQISFDNETGGRERSGNFMIDNSRVVTEFGMQFRPYRERVLNDLKK
jgi:2-keto-4-pentenoate hydratase